MPVKEVLDFDDEGESIFTREKPLSEKTLERIYAGLEKFVGNGESKFIAKYFSGRPEGKVHSINEPTGAIKTIDSHSLVNAQFLLKYNSTNGKTGKHIPPSIDEPSPVISCQGRLGLVAPKFLQHYYGNGFNTGMEDPCPTLTTKERIALVECSHFIDREFTNGGKGNPSSIEVPIGALLSVPKSNIVEVSKFITPTNFNNGPISLEEPMQTITANRKHHYLINPQYHNGGSSIDNPCFTLIARMDKRPPHLVLCETGEAAIEVYETDSPMTVKIKEFMAYHGLIDIKMRMLRVKELLKIQGFPDDYKMVGNQSDQKKFIGNSVHPLVVKKWVLAFVDKFKSKQIAA
jgi:DNA (cytosine-5)-methyltransferase 1